MAPSFSRVSSGALLLALAYNARPVNADFWEDVDNCKLVLDDLPADLTTDFCHDWTYGYEPEDEYVTVTGYPVTVTEYSYAKTCEGEGYSTTTKYPESTPEPSKPTKVPDESTKVPDESTKVPDESTKVPDQTTKAPDQPPATDMPGGHDVTVTSTTYTTYWTTSTVYEGYPTEAPAPYRRHARDLKDRAAWCVDRPCRLVQYDDDTIVEACKKYLGWEPHSSTVNVPGYTVTITSYPTDCKKKDDAYKPEPIPAYPTEKEEDYKPEPYPTETAEPYPAKDDYSTETPPEYKPEPYPQAPAPYPEDEPDYDNGPSYGDGSYADGSYDDDSYDGTAPWDNTDSFDTNYSGPDGPLPWDDFDQTSELADAIDAGGYDDAAEKLGLDDAPWNALPVDYPQKRDHPTEESYDNSYGEDGVDYEAPSYDDSSYNDQSYDAAPEGDYDVVWVDENGNPTDAPSKDEDNYAPDVYDPNAYNHSEDEETDGYAPNGYGPDVSESGEYEDSGDYVDHSEAYPSEDYSENSYYDSSYGSLPDSSEYEGDEFESDYTALAEDTSDAPSGDYWGEDGVDY